MGDTVLRLQPFVPFGFGDREVEAALKPAPRKSRRVKQIADVDVVRAEVHLKFAGTRASVEQGIGVADQRPAALSIQRLVAAGRIQGGRLIDSVRLTGDQIDRTWRRRPELRVVGVIVQCEVLRILPHRGDRVAIVVAHDLTRRRDCRRSENRGSACRTRIFRNRSIRPLSNDCCSGI